LRVPQAVGLGYAVAGLQPANTPGVFSPKGGDNVAQANGLGNPGRTPDGRAGTVGSPGELAFSSAGGYNSFSRPTRRQPTAPVPIR